METVYRSPAEELPQNMPTPKGKLVHTTTYFDTNLMHDVITGRSASGVLHFLNQTPWEWFSKHQAQVETATYGSEFMAAHQAIEQIMDIHYTLRMFGVLIDGASWLFGDNKSVAPARQYHILHWGNGGMLSLTIIVAKLLLLALFNSIILSVRKIPVIC